MAAPLGRACCCRFLQQTKVFHLSRAFSTGHAILQQTQSRKPAKPKITIPKRIERTPTAILEALASTLKKDYDAPHYRYVDDPYLIPASSIEKRTYSLSRASGYKAAEFAMANFPRGFSNDVAFPSIEDFNPKLPPQHSEDTVMGLQERIDRKEPLVAFQSYQALKEAGTAVAPELVDSLLELLCFYNSEDPVLELHPDEQYFQNELKDTMQALRKTWKSKGPAEQLFLELTEKSHVAYLSLLRGRAKYMDVDGTWDLFTEMRQKNMGVTTEAFDAVFSVTPFLKEKAELRWELINDLLKDMVKRELSPTLTTFNNILYTLSRSFRFRKARGWALQVIQEMKDIGIEPSPASWYYVIRTVYGTEDVTSDVLNQIIDHLEGKELVGREPADFEFFATAMAKCYLNLKDLELAYKIDNLLNTGHNFFLMGGGYSTGTYYTFFLRTLCMFEQIDKIFENYERITPHVYTPTFMAYEELLRAIELNEGYKYLPIVWSDLVLLDYTRRSDLVEQVLHIMGKKKQEPELQGLYVQISEYILQKFEEEKLTQRLKPFQLTGTMIGDLIKISVNGDMFAAARNYFDIYQENRMSIERFPSEQSLEAFSEACIENNEATYALQCLQLMADCAYPKVDTVAMKISKGIQLTEAQKNFIDDLL